MIENSQHWQLITNAFPHIGKKLQFFWGHPEFNAYIDGLQHDTREGQRAGFRAEILNALFGLALEHEKAHPHLLVKQTDIWSQLS